MCWCYLVLNVAVIVAISQLLAAVIVDLSESVLVLPGVKWGGERERRREGRDTCVRARVRFDSCGPRVCLQVFPIRFECVLSACTRTWVCFRV